MSYEIEKAVLFYMTQGFDDGRINEILFSSIHDQIIFRKVREIKKSGGPLDLVVLADSLSGEVPTSYISTLGDFAIKGGYGETYFREYIGQLVRLQRERQFKAVVPNILKGLDPIPTLRDYLAGLELEETFDIAEASFSARVPTFRSYVEAKRGHKLWGHDLTSLPGLAGALMGIREIIVLAAKPKTGKSTLALQIASDINAQGVPVLIFDFENGPFNLMARELSRKNHLTLEEILPEMMSVRPLSKRGSWNSESKGIFQSSWTASYLSTKSGPISNRRSGQPAGVRFLL